MSALHRTRTLVMTMPPVLRLTTRSPVSATKVIVVMALFVSTMMSAVPLHFKTVVDIIIPSRRASHFSTRFITNGATAVGSARRSSSTMLVMDHAPTANELLAGFRCYIAAHSKPMVVIATR